jgi:hypothetical protein
VRKWFVRLCGGAVMALAVLATVFLLGMRTKSPVVVNRVRRFNRAVTNPRVLRTAGSPGAPASVIRHVGRVSGREYETPVGPFEVGDHFVIALPYGPGADWVRNVLAQGSAMLVHEGRTVPIHFPRSFQPRTLLEIYQPPSSARSGCSPSISACGCARVQAADGDELSRRGAQGRTRPSRRRPASIG